jgi:hypothetical protein
MMRCRRDECATARSWFDGGNLKAALMDNRSFGERGLASGAYRGIPWFLRKWVDFALLPPSPLIPDSMVVVVVDGAVER